MKKLTALVLCLVMVLSLMAPAMAEEKPTLTLWIQEDLRIEDYETNAMTLWLEEQLGCNLDFVIQPSSDYKTKVNMALTVGAIEDLPDVILFSKQATDSDIWEWAQAETILPLNEYYANAELAEHINKAIERTGINYPQQITSPDGNLYAIASYNQSYGNEYGDKTWIYTPWLEKLGKEIPTTTDEWYEMLKAVKEGDPNGNGKADEIGMMGTTFDGAYPDYYRWLMNAFVYTGDDHYRTVTDGVVGAAYTTEEWRDGLRYMKKLFDEGLIIAESLTMATEQFKTLINSEDPSTFSICYAAPDMINKDFGRDVEFLCIAPLTGPKGVQYATYSPSVAWPSFVITANCEQPELAFKLGDLLSSEQIGISQRWGAEGVDWDRPANVADIADYKPSVAGFELSLITYSDGTFWGGTDMTNGSWRQHGPYVRQYGLANGWGTSATKEDKYTDIFNAGASLYQNGGWAPAEVIPKLILTTDESDAVAEIEANLKTYVQESIAAFVTGTKDLDADWAKYLAEFDKIGLEEYLEVAQGVYDRMYK